MFRLPFLVLLAAVLAAGAGKKGSPAGQSSNDAVALSATLHDGKESIEELLGSDLGGAVAVVEVRLAPKGDEPIAVSRDDFLLRSEKDGQRSQPFAPSQIAGPSVLVVSSRGGGGAGGVVSPGGPIWGGIGGNRPRRVGGDETAVGNVSGESKASASVEDRPVAKDSPLLAALKEKVLPEKKTSEPLSGLLYFQLEGKHKAKDLVLEYKSPAGKLIVRFR